MKCSSICPEDRLLSEYGIRTSPAILSKSTMNLVFDLNLFKPLTCDVGVLCVTCLGIEPLVVYEILDLLNS